MNKIHQWTNGTDHVLVLRYLNSDATSYGGFQNPVEPGSVVTAPDWDPEPECGNGLHGWAWRR